MATLERLEILIDVVDRFSATLDELLLQLGEVEAVAEKVEDINIKVDVRGQNELRGLLAQMGALEAMDVAGVGDIHVRTTGIPGGAAGATGGAGVVGATEEVTESLNNAARSLDQMADTGSIFDLRMSDMHNLLAKLVPLILTFIGALPALIAGLVVLATAAVAAASALFALGALGALGFAIEEGGVNDIMGGFEDIISEVRSDFLDAFAPLAEDLAPAFRGFLDWLDQLFGAIAARGDILINLTDEAAAFGDFLMDLIPDLLADMGRMVEAFAPIFGDFASLFDFNVLRAFTEFMADAADELILFTKLLMAFIPQIVELSLGFLQVVNAIGVAVHAFTTLLDMLPIGMDAIGALIGTILTLITVIGIWKAVQSAQLIPTLAATMPRIAQLIVSIDTYIVHALTAAGASVALAEAISLLLIATGVGAVLLGIGVAVGIMADKFSAAETDITSATEALREFDSVAGAMGGRGEAFGVDPSTARRRASPRGGGGGNVNITVEGNADEETIRKQANNATFRLQRNRSI